MDDCLIIGGGVIGLSLAWELAGRGERVRVLDQSQPGQEASWAGAGILPPGRLAGSRTPLEALTGLSNELHAAWSGRLRELTGIDNGYRRCGGLYLTGDGVTEHELASSAESWRNRGIAAELVTGRQLANLEPLLRSRADDQDRIAALHLPDEAQVRNPWHLRALLVACERADVAVEGGTRVEGFDWAGGRLLAARTPRGPRPAERFCVTGGAWSAGLLAPLGIALPIVPIRGQIVLFNAGRRLFAPVVNVGRRYLVPREDGRVLAGSTEEDVGFDKRTTEEAVAELAGFARELVPALAEAEIERAWAGLRPGTPDELPYLGPLPGLDNAWVAAGHFRSGLQLSPGTAVAMARLIRGEPPPVDLGAFSVDRAGAPGDGAIAQ